MASLVSVIEEHFFGKWHFTWSFRAASHTFSYSLSKCCFINFKYWLTDPLILLIASWNRKSQRYISFLNNNPNWRKFNVTLCGIRWRKIFYQIILWLQKFFYHYFISLFFFSLKDFVHLTLTFLCLRFFRLFCSPTILHWHHQIHWCLCKRKIIWNFIR